MGAELALKSGTKASKAHRPDCIWVRGRTGLRTAGPADIPAGCCHPPTVTSVSAGDHVPSRVTLPEGLLNADRLAQAIGATRRHIDHWTDLGHLTSLTGGAPGSGHQRAYDTHEAKAAAWIKRLRDGGVELDAASRMARELMSTGASQIAGLTVIDNTQIEAVRADSEAAS